MLVNADIFADIEGFGDNLEEYIHENNAFDALLNYQEQFYGSHEPLQNISEPMQYFFAIFPLLVPEAADVINPMTLTCKCSTTVVLPVANICKDIWKICR